MTDTRDPHGLASEWPLLVAGAGAGAGLLLLVVGVGGFRPGATLIGVSVTVAAALRAALSEERAGLLAVRARATDVVTLAVLGVAIIALAQLVPAAT